MCGGGKGKLQRGGRALLPGEPQERPGGGKQLYVHKINRQTTHLSFIHNLVSN